MALLHIYDSSDPAIVQTADARGLVYRLPIADVTYLCPELDNLVATRQSFDRVLFETHGSPGRISFNHRSINAAWWRSVVGRNYTFLTTSNARVYFNGCNVAEGAAGWDFLDAAAAVFLTPGGGEVFGQTSRGYGNPFNGHVVHLWGDTRRVFVNHEGRIIERLEQ